MRLLGFTLLACLVCSAIATPSGTSPLPSDSYGLSDYQRGLSRTISALRPVLRGGTRGVRLSYGATCTAATNLPPVQPLMLDEASQSSVGVSAAREIFRRDHEVKVTSGARAIVRIRIGNVEQKLLMTRVRDLRLQLRDQYDPGLIIAALENTDEMVHAINELDMRPASVLHINPTQWPGPRIPHLSSKSLDMTVDEILDELAAVFRGVVVYGACNGPRPRRFFISFAYVI